MCSNPLKPGINYSNPSHVLYFFPQQTSYYLEKIEGLMLDLWWENMGFLHMGEYYLKIKPYIVNDLQNFGVWLPSWPCPICCASLCTGLACFILCYYCFLATSFPSLIKTRNLDTSSKTYPNIKILATLENTHLLFNNLPIHPTTVMLSISLTTFMRR